MTQITREQATEFVDGLVQAYRDYDTVFPNKRSYREHYYAERERMITALLVGYIPGAGSKADDTEGARGADTDGGQTAGSIPATGAFFECPKCGSDLAIERCKCPTAISQELMTALTASTKNLREAAEYISDSIGDEATASLLHSNASANESTLKKYGSHQ